MSFKVVRALCKPKVHFIDPSLTRQEFAASADMNYIVSKFLRTGQVEQPNLGRPMVDGLEYPNDFTEACNLAFEQRNEEIRKNNEQETLELQKEPSSVPPSADVQGVSKVGKEQNSKVEQQDPAL